MSQQVASSEIDPRVFVGHVHLKVADIERSLAFYCGVLGFHVVERWGSDAAFIAAGDYHHHIGSNNNNRHSYNNNHKWSYDYHHQWSYYYYGRAGNNDNG